jgi:hypothetical protein
MARAAEAESRDRIVADFILLVLGLFLGNCREAQEEAWMA